MKNDKENTAEQTLFQEAIHHAIMRQNYGCTHIIIGRDHAGVGKFYDPMAAQKIFDDYPELDISPVFFPPFFYCRKCLTYTTPKACPHDNDVKEDLLLPYQYTPNIERHVCIHRYQYNSQTLVPKGLRLNL